MLDCNDWAQPVHLCPSKKPTNETGRWVIVAVFTTTTVQAEATLTTSQTKKRSKPCEAVGICVHTYSIHLTGSWRVLWKVCSYLYMQWSLYSGKVYQSWKGWYYHIHSCNGRSFFSEIWGENRECGHYTEKTRHFFFRKSFQWYLPLLNYSTRLYWLWLFLAIAVARQLPARINGEALRISDDIVLEAETKSWRLCFCLNGGAKNSAQLPCFATH